MYSPPPVLPTLLPPSFTPSLPHVLPPVLPPSLVNSVPPKLRPGPGGAAGRGIVEQLNELAELKAQGLLTDEEFAAAKAKMLSP